MSNHINLHAYLIPAVISFVLVSTAFYFFRQPDSTPEPAAETSDMFSAPNSQTCESDVYVDNELGFSVSCPPDMYTYTMKDEFNQDMGKLEKILQFCETPLEIDDYNERFICKSGGLKIWANGEGFGGGCDPEHWFTLTINGSQEPYCLINTSISFVHTNDGKLENEGNEYRLSGTFSDSFTKENLLNTIASFKTF